MIKNTFSKLTIIFTIATMFLASSYVAFADEPTTEDSFAASLKRHEVNVRKGPGTQYPILWVFKRKGWPVQVVNSYNNWYKIEDIDGESGWVFSGMVSKKRTALTSDKNQTILYKNSNGTYPIIKFQPFIVLDIINCSDIMCSIRYNNYEGWVQKSNLIGLGN